MLQDIEHVASLDVEEDFFEPDAALRPKASRSSRRLSRNISPHRLNYFSPVPIEGQNQTTQAPYCAAYVSVLATKYGSFIPAVSEHNAGGTNVGGR